MERTVERLDMILDDLKEFSSKEINSKVKIFLAAAQLFAEKGYNGASMREISEKSGFSKPTIYYYFGNKKGIYTALVRTGLKHALETIEKIRQEPLPAKGKIAKWLKSIFNYTLQFPEFTRFILNIFVSSERFPFLQEMVDYARKEQEILTSIVKAGIENGEFGASANPELAAEILMGTTSHFLWKQLNCDEAILSDELADQIMELLFKGLNE